MGHIDTMCFLMCFSEDTTSLVFLGGGESIDSLYHEQRLDKPKFEGHSTEQVAYTLPKWQFMKDKASRTVLD